MSGGQDSDKGKVDHIAELEQRNLTLQLLNHAGQALTATLDLEQVMERLLQIATQIMNAEGSSVWLWDDEAPDWLVCRAAFHPDEHVALLGQRVQRGQGVAGWVAETGRSTVVAQADADVRFYGQIDAQSGFTTRSMVAVPLTQRDDVLGVLEVVNKLDGPFTAHDLAVTETLAASAAVAIDNARLVAELQQKMAELEERNKELDAFDHTVAHNLQNPLSLIIGFTTVLQDPEMETAVPQEVREVLQMIGQSAQRMSNIVKELLLLSSVRKSEVETSPLQMSEIVDNALQRLDFLITESGAVIERPSDWPTAVGYAAWVEEVWENYLSNAIKYGGKPPHIVLGGEEKDGIVRFWVRDNGQGLTKEEQARLFTPFARLGDVRVTGHGLGLSIVQRIMERLNGRVGVESTPGKGSTFSFALPAVESGD